MVKPSCSNFRVITAIFQMSKFFSAPLKKGTAKNSDQTDVDAQADLSLCWVLRSFCWFCHALVYFRALVHLLL